MYYHFKIHKEGKCGYWAECVELKGAVTQADSLKELEANMEEALNLYLDEREDSELIFPLPKEKVSGRNIVKVRVDPKIAFAVLARAARKELGLSQRQTAQRMEVPLRSYQLLESPKLANPRWLTIDKLLQVMPNFRVKLLAAA